MENNLDKIRKERRLKLKAKSFKKAFYRYVLIYGGLSVLIISIYLSITYVIDGLERGKVHYPSPPLSSDRLGYLVEAPNSTKKNSMVVYEDFRCPVCRVFEETYGADISSLMQSGKIQLTYYVGSFLDSNLGGTGSIIAANSAACAQDLHAFKPYHDLLYKNQPSEMQDSFSDKNYLAAIGAQVPEIQNNMTQFKKCMDAKKYINWAKKVQNLFVERKIEGTPTFVLNGKKVDLLKYMKDRNRLLQILNNGHE